MAMLAYFVSPWHITDAHPVTSSVDAVAPARGTTAVRCQPCGFPVDGDEIGHLQNATYELRQAVNVTITQATRLQRSALVSSIYYTRRHSRTEYLSVAIGC